MSSEKFTLAKILKLKKQNESREQDIVDYHYKNIVYKIKDSYKNYLEGCYYDVDQFVARLPMYDSTEIADKLVKFMKRKKFNCKVVYQNRIFIWWKKKERKKEHLPVLLKGVYSKIEKFAKENHDYCFHEIPLTLAGFPWYDSIEATLLIAQKISDKGFIVKVIEDSNWMYISWKKDEVEKKSNIKIKFQTNEEKRIKALEKINFINEQRYVDFVNPKTSKVKSKIDLDEPKPPPKKNVFNSGQYFNNEFLRGLSNLKNDVNKYTT